MIIYPYNKNILHFTDVETCGFSPTRSSVVSLAWVTTDSEGNKLGEFYEEVRAENATHWNTGSERIHGFTKADNRKKQSAQTCLLKLLKYLKPFESDLPAPLVYHAKNAFDPRWIESMFFKNLLNGIWIYRKHTSFNNHIDTIALAEEKLPSLENYKLSTLCRYFGISLNHHHALSDTRALPEIYFNLLKL
ncbi:exonuclease domain-containing protein [Flavobacterium alkalisoli]|uniref:3'-5' exonuclease n=1 Tax=Flavobacterium alkalisoli TaxID=2602769 RepID=UPI003A9002D2